MRERETNTTKSTASKLYACPVLCHVSALPTLYFFKEKEKCLKNLQLYFVTSAIRGHINLACKLDYIPFT